MSYERFGKLIKFEDKLEAISKAMKEFVKQDIRLKPNGDYIIVGKYHWLADYNNVIISMRFFNIGVSTADVDIKLKNPIEDEEEFINKFKSVALEWDLNLNAIRVYENYLTGKYSTDKSIRILKTEKKIKILTGKNIIFKIVNSQPPPTPEPKKKYNKFFEKDIE